MGRIAAELADRVVLTNDNPRSEAPGAIIAGIRGGIDAGVHVDVIEDRAAAIAWVIGEAAEGDVVLIAGKGHESSQVIGDRQFPFSDYAVAEAALAGGAS